MGSAGSGDVRPRRSRRSRKGSPADADAPRGQLLSESHKRLLQIGSAAAAIGSVLALVFTVGDRASGLLKGNDGGPRVSVADVELEPMSLQQYLVTKERKTPPFPPQYTEKDLQRDVLVVTFHAEYNESAPGVRFPYWITLLGRKGTRVVVAEPPLERNALLKKADDACDCHEVFNLPPRGRQYRAQVQIMDPEAPPNSQPIAEAKSDWYRLPQS
jgi:hypothetical protein